MKNLDRICKDKFISKPNSCKGCPIYMSVSIKQIIMQECKTSDYSVVFRIDKLGRTICEVDKL